MASDHDRRPGRSEIADHQQPSNLRPAHIQLLAPPPWNDYELIDSGDGKKFERFGQYYLVRPETQAIWSPALPLREWTRADVSFERTRGDEGMGQWVQRRPLPEQWALHHDNLAFWARLTPFRHTGIFPEHSAHWGWLRSQLAGASTQPNILVLFGYTGLTTLFAAQIGARVCHVDASRPATRWAQENQELSQLRDRPVRWIVDDVVKFVARELRRGARYDLIVMDPPVFGRGPKGEIWRLTESLPEFLHRCVELLSPRPLGLLINAYATNISSLALYNLTVAATRGYGGTVTAGELVLVEQAASRLLPAALFARWSAE